MKSRAIFILPASSANFNEFNLPSWNVWRIPPIGLIVLASYLYAKGHNVKVIDCRDLIVRYKTNEYIPFLLKIVEEFRPDMVGISMVTALFDGAKDVSCAIRGKFPDCLIIAGGVHPSVEPALTFKQIPHIDAICVGSGEEVCLDILDGKKISGIQGLMRRNYIDKFIPRPVELNIDKYPFPNYNIANSKFYSDFSLRTLTGWGCKGLGTVTSRSCPFSCKFCASDWSKPFRYHSPEYVVEMAKYLSTYDINVISFWDDTIAASQERLHKICEGFIRSKLFYPHTNLRWSCDVRANQATPDVLELMRKAGCFNIGIGIESGSARMLKVINKKATVEMNKRACAYVNKAGLSLVTSFIFGLPSETEDEMNETLTFAKSISSKFNIQNFRPLPGSPFYNEFVENGTLSKEGIDWTNLGDFSAAPKYLFCDVPREKIEELHDKAIRISLRTDWNAIHKDYFLRHQKEIKDIAHKAKIRIAELDTYELSTHMPYTPFSIRSIYNTLLLILQTILPYKLRRRIRPAMKLMRRERRVE